MKKRHIRFLTGFAILIVLLGLLFSINLFISPDKEEKMPKNRLAQTLSPYLLQHADNPVDWFPWGDEAFKRARDENKPIFLSIGYSACHWCHVMEHESFENDEIAAFLNEHFISIKVDREERPDVDEIYMTAVRLLTGSGGWPLTVFLTPDLKPFYGGTYFPPVSKFGRPGFLDLLKGIQQVYRDEPNKIKESVNQISSHLSVATSFTGTAKDYSKDAVEKAIVYIQQTFEPKYGGFGPAPKFPPTGSLDLLARDYAKTGISNHLAMMEKTLKEMGNGGIFDQLAGGFHRYSVDAQWLVPHFEKMLYDNALLINNYLDLYLLSKDEYYSGIVRHTISWVIAEMQDKTGGFYSSQDADSEGEEGLYYIWKRNEVLELLGKEDADMMCRIFNITEDGNFEGSNILTMNPEPGKIASELGITTEELESRINKNRLAMLQHRHKRIHPGTDDKILTDWNSLMISALARAHRILGDAEYLKAAESAADFVVETMFDGNQLLHSYREGIAGIHGMLEDYAYLIEALIELYQASFNEKHILTAESLSSIMIEKFRDKQNGAFFQVADGQSDLLFRLKQAYDSATPSGTAIAARSLLKLYQLTHKNEYLEYADEAAKLYYPAALSQPGGYLRLISLIDELTSPIEQLAFVGNGNGTGNQDMLKIVNSSYRPNLVLAYCKGSDESKLGILQDRKALNDKVTAFYCVDFACKLPVTDTTALKEAMSLIIINTFLST